MIQLPPEDVTKLQNYEHQIALLGHELDRAAEAGLDVSDMREALKKIEELRAGLLRVYGPNVRKRSVVTPKRVR